MIYILTYECERRFHVIYTCKSGTMTRARSGDWAGSAGLSIEGTVDQSHLTLSVSFGRDTKVGGPFYLVSMIVEVQDPIKEINV